MARGETLTDRTAKLREAHPEWPEEKVLAAAMRQQEAAAGTDFVPKGFRRDASVARGFRPLRR